MSACHERFLLRSFKKGSNSRSEFPKVEARESWPGTAAIVQMMLHPAALTRQATNDQHALNGRPYADPFPKAVTRGEVYRFQRRPRATAAIDKRVFGNHPGQAGNGIKAGDELWRCCGGTNNQVIRVPKRRHPTVLQPLDAFPRPDANTSRYFLFQRHV